MSISDTTETAILALVYNETLSDLRKTLDKALSSSGVPRRRLAEATSTVFVLINIDSRAAMVTTLTSVFQTKEALLEYARNESLPGGKLEGLITPDDVENLTQNDGHYYIDRDCCYQILQI